MKTFLGKLAFDVLRAAAITAIGVLVRELIDVIDSRRGNRPYDGHWYEED